MVERLGGAFMNCEKLQRHIRFLYTKGSLYKVYNEICFTTAVCR